MLSFLLHMVMVAKISCMLLPKNLLHMLFELNQLCSFGAAIYVFF